MIPPGPACQARPWSTASAFVVAVLLVALELAGCGGRPAGAPLVTSVGQLRSLSEEQVQAGVPVRITGVVTYSDRFSSFCFVQDATGGIRVVLAPGETPASVASNVVVSGLAGSAKTAPSVIQAKMLALGAATLPAPAAIRSGELRAVEYEYREVILAGVVQAIQTERPGLMSIDLRAYGTTIRLKVPASSTVIADDWIDSEIRASGVLTRTIDANGAATLPVLWVSNAAAIEKAKPEKLPIAPHRLLTTAREVHSLPLDAPQPDYPVHLRAVVTYSDPAAHLLFVQDRTDGVLVRLSEATPAPLRPGDLVDVTGAALAGGFAPDVSNARLLIVGHAELPEIKSGNLENVLLGRADSRWVELEGVVQQVDPGDGDTLLSLAWGKETYQAHVLGSPASLASLVDAEVSLRGVCGTLFNARRQLPGIQLFVPGEEYIRVLRAAPGDPFSQKTRSIEYVLGFSRSPGAEHRVRVRGTVTYDDRSGSVWVRDATGGIMIQGRGGQELTPGDVLDVVGFAGIGSFSPVLRGALVRKVQSGPPPIPERITVLDALAGGFDAHLVQIDGRLIDALTGPGAQTLTLESGGTIFSAILPTIGGAPRLQPGTVLRLSGICRLEVDPSHDLSVPRTFGLLLRSPADIVTLKGVPWLTAGRVGPVLTGAAALLVAALAWAGLLRRRVNPQTGDLIFKTIQLQEANRATREALQKAREAEALELDRKRILELVARDEAIELIIDQIAEAVAVHCKNTVCAILLAEQQSRRVTTVPAMPAGWLEILERLEISAISFAAEFREPKQICADPAWIAFLDSHPGTPFRSVYAAPIMADAGSLGAIVVFFRDQKPAEEAFGEQIGLWCSIAVLALERRRLYEQLSFRAQYDVLTGLPNRALLYERLQAEIALAARSGSLLGILYIDLDGFKETNDVFGHGAGDAVLQEVSRRMTHSVRRGDTVGRMGGDEFVVLLPMLGRREDAEHISAKITASLRQPVSFNQHSLTVGASVGIGIWPLDGDQPDLLLKSADAHMYREKNTKRRRWYETEVHPPEQPVTAARTRIPPK